MQQVEYEARRCELFDQKVCCSVVFPLFVMLEVVSLIMAPFLTEIVGNFLCGLDTE